MTWTSGMFIVVSCVVAWVAAVVVVDRVLRPRLARLCGDDVWYGVARLLALVYSRVLHGVQFDGAAELRATVDPGALIVVSNHTAGIDPLLIQSGCRFFVRWLMAEDMMVASMSDFWRWAQIIAVNRDGRDRRSLREGLRHLRGGGVLGLFPEGGITRPPNRIEPFMPGVGLLAAKSGAPVLLVFLSGTPQAPSAYGSLVRPSHARVRFELLPPFPASMTGQQIADALRDRLAALSGLPLAAAPDADEPEATPDPLAQ